MIEGLLKQHSAELVGALAGQSELDEGEAKALVPPALSGIGEALGGGGIDLAGLLGGQGGAGELLGRLDVGGIAAAAGLGEDRARSGLESLIPIVLSLLGDKAGGAEGLASLLGGAGGSDAMGAIGGLAGKLFGK
ncbi:MAG: hypothetical protein ACQGVK_05835 [Myxococcota bacterium]